MADSDRDERRKYSRVAFKTQIEIHLEASSKTIKLIGSSKDLSLKGIFVSTENTFEPQTQCDISILLTGAIDTIKLEMKGRVVRVTDGGMGIAFDSMDVDSYSHLKNVVQYNSMDNSI